MVTPTSTLDDMEPAEGCERVRQDEETEVDSVTVSSSSSEHQIEQSTSIESHQSEEGESFYELKQRRASRRCHLSKKGRSNISVGGASSTGGLQSSASTRSDFSDSFYEEKSPQGSTRILRALRASTSSSQTNLVMASTDEEVGLTRASSNEDEASPADITIPATDQDVNPASPSLSPNGGSCRQVIGSSSISEKLRRLESKALALASPGAEFVPGRVEPSSSEEDDRRDVHDNDRIPPEATGVQLVHATSIIHIDIDADERHNQNHQQHTTHELPVMYASALPMEEHEENKRRSRCSQILLGNLAVVVATAAIIAGFAVLSRRGLNGTMTPTPTAAPTFSEYGELVAFLSAASLDGGAALSNSSTPQGQALAWLLDRELNPRLSADYWTVDRYAMATLYYALNGPSWNKRDKWLGSESVCEWYSSGGDGLPCNEAGMLTEIDLNRNRLQGTLPMNELVMLAPRLKVLDLFGNELTGTIPSELGLLTQLRTLFLERNQLEGEVPTELGQLESLLRLYLDDNDLVGEIPSAVCDLNIPILWADCLEVNCTCCTKCCVDGISCSTPLD